MGIYFVRQNMHCIGGQGILQYNYIQSMWNNSILRNSPGNARPTHRQFKASSSPYYPHANQGPPHRSSCGAMNGYSEPQQCWSCLFVPRLQLFFGRGILLDRAIRVHLATVEYNQQGIIFFFCAFQPLRRVPGAPEQAGKTHRIPIDKYERTKKIVCTAF